MPTSRQRALDVVDVLAGTPYRAVARVAEGGMGEIYEAIAPERELLAVKLLRPELACEPDLVDRMRVEGEVLELVAHPNVVLWRGHGTTAGGRPYVAMERLKGRTLQDELRNKGALPVAEAVHYTRQLLAALDKVHEAGIVHRDVKPGNLMLCRTPTGRQLKLLDFGVVKVGRRCRRRIAPLSFPTREGLCVGTPRYVSPEQARGGEVDARTDVYAAGVVLYTLIAGRGPFDEIKGGRGILQAHVEEPPPPPSRFSKAPLPQRLEAAILRALAKSPADRFDNAAEFRRELARATQSLGGAGFAELDAAATSKTTAIARRFDLVTTVIPRAARGGARRTRRPGRKALVAPRPVSPSGVFFSAVGFFAIAGGLAMWFVR